MAFIKRHFAYENPRFGRSKKEKSLEPYKNSVYYYWWEFLRRSDTYKKCCKSQGRGFLKSLYADFGDVFEVDFKTWWQTNDRGAHLFAEQLSLEFKVIKQSESLIDSDELLYVQVPLNLPKRYLMREFQNVLNKNHKGGRGIRTNKISTAKYAVSGHVDIDALDKCLRVYDMRKQYPKMPLWEVAQKCRVCSIENNISDDGKESKQIVFSKKLVLANTASRLIKKAKVLISNVEKGLFPKSN